MKKTLGLLLVTCVLASCGGDNKTEKTLDSETGKISGNQVLHDGVPNKLAYEGTELILNGRGTRNKYFVKAYVCGLYLPEKCKNPEEIIQSEGAVGIRLHMSSILITRDNMERVVREGFVRSTGGKTANIQKQIDELMFNFQKTPVNVGDKYDMWYMPGKGLQGFKNEKPWGPIIVCGPEYRSALVGIWLSNDPVDPDLKVNLLGL